jgi:hypothetical protein
MIQFTRGFPQILNSDGSVAGIATTHVLDDPGLESRQGQQIFSSPKRLGPLGVHAPSSSMCNRIISWIKAARAWS